MNSEQQLQQIPEGAVRYNEYDTGWNDNHNIMSMRWESKELMERLWKNLAYMSPATFNGVPYLVPEPKATPPINYEGARAVINIVQSVVNPVASLSKISEQQALMLVKHIKQLCRRLIVVKGEEFGCTRRVDKQNILQVIENIIFLQLMRPVGGHESQHSRSNLTERREEGSYSTTGGGFKLPWSKDNQGVKI